MQQVKFRQRTLYGCGSFSLANIFDDHRFVEEIPVGHGERLPDLQRKMNKFHRSLFIDSLFLTNITFKAGNRLAYSQRAVFEFHKDGMTGEDRETMCLPYLVGIGRHNRFLHNVAVFHNMKDNMFYVVDSCVDHIMKFTLKKMIQEFDIVAVSVFRFWNNPEQGNLAIAPKSEFSHIFNPED